MQLSRRIRFDHLVINPDDLGRLASLVNSSIAELSAPDGGRRYFSMTLRYADNSDVRLDALPATLNSYLGKKIVGAGSTCRESKSDKQVSVAINHGDSNSYLNNGAEIVGDEESWVNDIEAKLEAWKRSCPRQQDFFRRHWLIPIFIVGIPFALIYYKLLIKFATWASGPSTSPLRVPTRADYIAFGTLAVVLCFFGLLTSIWIISALQKLWPDVELRLGPAHELDFIHRRKFFLFVWAVVILPVAVNAIYDLLKLFVSW